MRAIIAVMAVTLSIAVPATAAKAPPPSQRAVTRTTQAVVATTFPPVVVTTTTVVPDTTVPPAPPDTTPPADPVGIATAMQALGASPEVANTFVCIAFHESRFQPTVQNPSGAAGLFQFMPSTWQSLGYSGTASDYPVSDQIAGAFRLWQRSGFSPWTGNACV